MQALPPRDAGVMEGLTFEPQAPDAGTQDARLDAPPARRAARFNVLLPFIESELLHAALAASNNVLLRENFAKISLDSIVSHLDGRRPWEADVDGFIVNQFGHPYQGALAFMSARTSGFSFWTSSLYAFLSSLTWELIYEVDAPSWNDQITTPIGGTFLGEVLHRSALLLLRSQNAPRWLRVLGAFLIEPMGQLNRTLFDGAYDPDDVADGPPYFAMLGAGVNLGTAYRDPNTLDVIQRFAPQANFQGRLTYGIPGDPHFTTTAPFSHFDLDFNLSVPGTPVASLFMRGLLAGQHFVSPQGSVRGLWGVFGQYDFASASLLRVSSVAFGGGTALQASLTDDVTLQLWAVLGVVPFGSAGSLGLEEGKARDYHIGAGAQLTVETRLLFGSRAWIRLVGRSWLIGGSYEPPAGVESVTYVTGGPMVRLVGPFALSADVVLAVRRASFPNEALSFDPNITGATGRITLNWLSSEWLGLAR